MWWCIATITTVGYGDAYPGTIFGKFIAAITMVCGILLLSLPVTIVGEKFEQIYKEEEAIKQSKRDEQKILKDQNEFEHFKKFYDNKRTSISPSKLFLSGKHKIKKMIDVF